MYPLFRFFFQMCSYNVAGVKEHLEQPSLWTQCMTQRIEHFEHWITEKSGCWEMESQPVTTPVHMLTELDKRANIINREDKKIRKTLKSNGFIEAQCYPECQFESRSWAGPKWGSRSFLWVSDVDARAQALGLSYIAFPVTSSGNQIISETAGTWTGAQIGWWQF